jgi:hypothetical protein
MTRIPTWLLCVAAVVCAAAGVGLLTQPEASPAAPTPTFGAASADPGAGEKPPVGAPTGGLQWTLSAAPAQPTGAPMTADGPGSDRELQRRLNESTKADLAKPVEAELVALGRRVLLADVTGAGRERWPAYFGVGPARSVYTRVRLRAAIARADGPGRVRVTVLWDGTDPRGEWRDRRRAEVVLVQHDGTWRPVR